MGFTTTGPGGTRERELASASADGGGASPPVGVEDREEVPTGSTGAPLLGELGLDGTMLRDEATRAPRERVDADRGDGRPDGETPTRIGQRLGRVGRKRGGGVLGF